MSWDDIYDSKQRLWGDQPGELAKFAAERLLQPFPGKDITILDLGCGYGRDALYLARSLNCRVTGVDKAGKAIDMGRDAAAASGGRVTLICGDFNSFSGTFPVVFSSNVYHLLEPEERAAFREAAKRFLDVNGLFFLSTLSVRDPQQYGVGLKIAGEDNSFQDEHYTHFCTRAELENDFSFLKIERLFEHEFNEPRTGGKDHHHIMWFLIARRESTI